MWIREGECHRCGECCQTVNITAVRDVTLSQHGSLEELRLYMKYRGIRVVGEDVKQNMLFYEIELPCDQLTRDPAGNYGCKVHDSPEKPLLCLKYPQAPDDITQCGYQFKRETSH